MTLLPVNLPSGAVLKILTGDKITAGQVIADRITPGTQEIIHVVSDYQIDLKDFLNSLKKNIGDGIKVGDIIAVKKKVFGGEKILSKISGTITKIDKDTGDVYVKTAGEDLRENIISPVDGTVTFCDNEKVVIKTQAAAIVAKDVLGKDITGELLVGNFSQANLTDVVKDKIVGTEKIDKVSIFKSIGLGALGIIATELVDIDFIDFSKDNLDLSVFLIDEKDFDKIKKENGKKIFASAANKVIML